jgi:drug/metabolite transporter (DMT)-like permease
MIWLILVLISAVAFSLGTLLKKVFFNRGNRDPYAYSIVYQLLTASLIFIYTLFAGFNLPPMRPLIGSFAIITVLYALGNITFFRGLKSTDASVASVLMSSRPIWVMIAAALFLQESISIGRLAGTILVVLGILLITWKHNSIKFKKGHFLILFSALSFGLAFIGTAIILRSMEAATFGVLAFTFPALFLMAINPKVIPKIKTIINKKTFLEVLGACFFQAIAGVAMYNAYRFGGDASQITPIRELSVVLTVILGYLILKEKTNIVRKIIGSIISFLGVLLLI